MKRFLALETMPAFSREELPAQEPEALVRYLKELWRNRPRGTRAAQRAAG